MSRHSPIPPEVVAEIRASAEPPVAIARRLGISRQSVSKIRSGEIHADNGQAREALVRSILGRSPLETHAAIAERFECNRETVRNIRFGLQWADVAPELERLDLITYNDATCYRCIHGRPVGENNGPCILDSPEAAIDGPTYARGCGAYLPEARKP